MAAVFDHGRAQRLDPEEQIRDTVAFDYGDDVERGSGGFFGQPFQRRSNPLERLHAIQLIVDLFEEGGELSSAFAARSGQGV